MRLISLSFALLLPLTACEQAATQAVDYRPEEAGTVDHALCLLGFTGLPMREMATGHQLVDLQLNGRPATFVVDTGANVSVLHTGHAEAFGISTERTSPAGAFGIGGATQARQARLESLRIGSVPIRRNRIVLADIAQMTALLGPLSGEPIHGIVGQDVLTEHRAVIDVPRAVLYLMVADRDPAPVAAERCEAPDVDEGDANGSGGSETNNG